MIVEVGNAAGNRAGAQTVMVIEDDADIRESLVQYLEFEGYRTLSAENGKVALELIESGLCPSLFLLDLFMPVMNGERFLTRLLESGLASHVPIVVISAAPDPEAVLHLVKHRVTAFLKKPASLGQLIETIQRYAINVDETGSSAAEGAAAFLPRGLALKP